jgi:hypothetical protein
MALPVSIQFNPTGTNVKVKRNGLVRPLEIRLDFIPEEGSPLYAMHHVWMPVYPDVSAPLYGYPGAKRFIAEGIQHWEPENRAEYNAWVESLAKSEQLNPFLSHFITVPETIKAADLEGYAKSLLSKDDLAVVQEIMLRPDSLHYISPFMRNRGKYSREAVQASDKLDLIMSVNEKMGGLVIPLTDIGKAYKVEHESIDIGPGATARSATAGADTTRFDLANPANDTGYLDSFEIYYGSNATGVKMGTFSGSGTSYTPRDYEAIGNVTAGSKHTSTGKNCDVVTGDYLGHYEATGGIRYDATGGSGMYYKTGDQFGAGTQTYTNMASIAISIYATGGNAVAQAVGGGSVSIGGALSRNYRQVKSVGGELTISGVLKRLICKGVGGGVGGVVTLTLRPNAAGDETNLIKGDPSGSNYEKVDEISQDGYTTYCHQQAYIDTWKRDLYNIIDADGRTGIINSVIVYAYLKANNAATQTCGKICCKSGSTVAESSEITVESADWTLYSQEWNTNPDTGAAWTWGEIDSLQIGVSLREPNASPSGFMTNVTQVYVEVNYTSEEFNISGSLSSIYRQLQSVGGSVSIAGALGLLIKKNTGGGAVGIAGVVASILRHFMAVGGGELTIAGALSSILKHFAAVGGGAITITGALKRLIKTAVGGGAVTTAGALGLLVKKGVGGGAVGIAGVVVWLYKILVGNGAVGIAGAISTWWPRVIHARVFTSAYRKARAFTALYRTGKVLTSLYRKAKAFTRGG